MIQLRPYQKEAVNYALRRKKVTLVLPTGTGKTIIGAYFLKNLLNYIRKALVLVPTRILVEQTYKVYNNLGIICEKIYGIHPKKMREKLWSNANVVISTPETVLNDLDIVGKVDVIIVDECHHAVGDDAYAKVLREIDCEYKLGLSAFIPRRIKKEIETYVGEIKEWSFSDLKEYVSEWIGTVLEVKFNSDEMKIYDEIDFRRSKVKGKEKLIYTSALKYFAKDGALALKESLSKENKLSKALEDLKEDVFKLRDLHKLDQLLKTLEIYEDFKKAIVFVDRVIVAKRIAEILKKNYNVSLIIGKQRGKVREGVENADTIVSTSAGEEGVDLPTADLLINWSNTSSPLRFIQRHGRIMRKVEGKVKFVVYLVTPYTVDADDLITSIDTVKKFIDINVDRNILETIWRKSRRYTILEHLTTPMPIEWIQEVTGKTLNEVRFALKKACETGEVIYIYTHLGKTYVRRDCIDKLKDFDEFLKPKHVGKVKIKGKRTRTIIGSYEELRNELANYLPLNGLEITVIKKVNEIEEYEFRGYNFLIDDLKVLDIVLRNALSDFSY
ncbi:MAG TPA: DEAD/DEAH box helicase [Archaeoglobus profundus]|nr:DEAD/DEAH box helicase [Archaeoglobus profundus]